MMESAQRHTVPHGSSGPPDMDRAEAIIREVTAELKSTPEAVGAILHGSYARGTARPDSDMDFLCAVDTPWMDKEIRLTQGIEVEIQRMPLRNLHGDITGRDPKPFTVATFAECRILFDQDGIIADLCGKAKEIWDKGPTEPSSVEVFFGKSYIRHHLDEIERLKDLMPESRFPLEALFSQAFLVSIRAFFRARGFWLLKISDALAEINTIDPEFASVVRGYIEAPDLESRIEYLKRVAAYAIRPLGELTVEYKTPRISVDMLPGAGTLLF